MYLATRSGTGTNIWWINDNLLEVLFSLISLNSILERIPQSVFQGWNAWRLISLPVWVRQENVARLPDEALCSTDLLCYHSHLLPLSVSFQDYFQKNILPPLECISSIFISSRLCHLSSPFHLRCIFKISIGFSHCHCLWPFLWEVTPLSYFDNVLWGEGINIGAQSNILHWHFLKHLLNIFHAFHIL